MQNKQKFWERVEISAIADDCWPWMGSYFVDGYGRIFLDGKDRRAHRIAYEIVNGPIQEGLIICHRCNDRSCCNPKHLYAGTYRQNNRDTVASGNYKGSKIELEDIECIKHLFLEGHSQCEIARMYDVTNSTIHRIVRNKTFENSIVI